VGVLQLELRLLPWRGSLQLPLVPDET
jgi:hypothetical protein